ncbi:hypothetical protein AAG747_12960 [Rapidithrix thailandica]|uniref:Uncharacterized protein n=1 Tax=Rapidithrix thailandica TaxID=413964 RepID=A0AAW9S8Z9_9BACT
MDKLSRYNQKLLAVIGTALLAAAAISLITGLGAFVISLMDTNGSQDNGLRIQQAHSNGSDSVEFVRTQEITFDSPLQLDTAQAKYIIPVGQVNLKTEEKVRVESGRGLKFSSFNYYYEAYAGLFNNFIYYDHPKKFTKKIFDEKIAITYWSFLKKDGVEVLLFKGTTTDDNADKQMDDNDYQTLFAYYLADDTLMRYEFENKTVLGFQPMHKTDLVSIQLGVDKDKDFFFDINNEPQEITTLNVVSRSIQNVITGDIKTEIQNIIDGIGK